MKKHISYFLFICLELSLFLLIIILAIKIKNISQDKVKGVQYSTHIKKEDVIFDSNNLKYFYEPKPNITQSWKPEWLGYEVQNTINSDGLNERYNYSIEKKEGVYRIILLGDSHTYGQYVKTENNYSEILEDLLNNRLKCNGINKFEIINLGVGGYDIRYAFERFKKRGIKYNPDLLIWLINHWNFLNNNEYLIPRQKELKEQGFVEFDSINRKYIIPDIVFKELQTRFSQKGILDYQREVLTEISQLYKGRLMITSYEGLSQIYKDVIRLFITLNPNYLYYDNLINIEKDESLHLLDGHPNEKGHGEIANKLFEYLSSHYFDNCTTLKLSFKM